MVRILDKRALRAKGVLYSNVHLLRLERADKFPQRFNLGDNRVAWLEEDVDRWIRERVTASSLKRQAVAASAGDKGQAARVVAARSRHPGQEPRE
jgi:prophage regulatory protein